MRALQRGVGWVRCIGVATLAVVQGRRLRERWQRRRVPAGHETDTGKGVAIGAVGGAALGAIIDHADPWAGVLVGAASGALIGGVAGHFMDQRKQDLAKQLQPQVTPATPRSSSSAATP